MSRQRHIPLNTESREHLDRIKKDYEERTGDVGDWARFLRTVSLAGMAALGIYSVAQLAKRGTNIWQIRCSRCGVIFPVQIPNPPPWRLWQIVCPKCESELVLDFSKATVITSQTREVGSSSIYCHYCEQPIDIDAMKVNPRDIEYIKCTRCDRVARMRSWE